MARAKRTARADARRRYRADQGQPDTTEDDEVPSARTTAPTSAGPIAPAAGARQGIGASFRLAFRPIDVRGDLRSVPTLVRHRALWLPILLVLASTAIKAAAGSAPSNSPLALLALFVYQYFIIPPGIGAVFVAGFLAPRASWLIGGLVALASAVCFSFLSVAGYVPTLPGAVIEPGLVIGTALYSIVPGALFASAAAWYRRFLTLSNPNRGRTPASAGRRPDGRSRATPSKSGSRR